MNTYWNSLIGDSQSWASSFENQIPTELDKALFEDKDTSEPQRLSCRW